jgi:hypothetical protein
VTQACPTRRGILPKKRLHEFMHDRVAKELVNSPSSPSPLVVRSLHLRCRHCNELRRITTVVASGVAR